MSLRSEDVKKNNSVKLLNAIMRLSNATIAEIEAETNFSRSLVRSILKEFEEKNLLLIHDIDASQGGRCATRYKLNDKLFRVLIVFLYDDMLHLEVRDVFNNIIKIEKYSTKKNIDLNEIIFDISKKYKVSCISIGASGIVQGRFLYNDVDEKTISRRDVVEDLTNKLNIPVVLENDVNCMVYGMKSEQHTNDLAYIYTSDTGVGVGFIINGKIHYGNQSFAGELGLLPFEDKSINKMIKSQPSLEIRKEIYKKMLITLAVTVAPKNIVISDRNLDDNHLNNILNSISVYFGEKYKFDICLSSTFIDDAITGSYYMGIEKLFDEYTKYERKKRNG